MGAARSFGPTIARYLDRRSDPDARAAAALALSQIEDASSISALIAVAADFDDDWLLAYNSVESLGRLHALQARNLLVRTAQMHWHWDVRDNARRALSALDGGTFQSSGRKYSAYGMLRREPIPSVHWCRRVTDNPASFTQGPAGEVGWPEHGAHYLRLTGPSGREADAVQFMQTNPKGITRGVLTTIVRRKEDALIGTDGGEFGGGLFRMRGNEAAQRILDGNVKYAFQMSGRTYVVDGLSHLGLNRGRIWVVEDGQSVPSRTIRLPGDPKRIAVVAGHTIVLETTEGDVAIAEDGHLRDPATLAYCGSGN